MLYRGQRTGSAIKNFGNIKSGNDYDFANQEDSEDSYASYDIVMASPASVYSMADLSK